MAAYALWGNWVHQIWPIINCFISTKIIIFKAHIVIEYHISILYRLYIFLNIIIFFILHFHAYKIGCTKMFSFSLNFIYEGRLYAIITGYKFPANKDFNMSLRLQFLIPFCVHKNLIKIERNSNLNYSKKS